MTGEIEKRELEDRALADHAKAVGTIVRTQWVYGYRGDNSVDVPCDPPAEVRVVDTLAEDITHWIDDWLDPYWDVELVDPANPQFAGVTSPWIFGPSYQLTKKEKISEAK